MSSIFFYFKIVIVPWKATANLLRFLSAHILLRTIVNTLDRNMLGYSNLWRVIPQRMKITHLHCTHREKSLESCSKIMQVRPRNILIFFFWENQMCRRNEIALGSFIKKIKSFDPSVFVQKTFHRKLLVDRRLFIIFQRNPRLFSLSVKLYRKLQEKDT